jgi:hypothetical protein
MRDRFAALSTATAAALTEVVRVVHEYGGSASRGRRRLAHLIRILDLLFDRSKTHLLFPVERAELILKLVLRRDELVVIVEYTLRRAKIL